MAITTLYQFQADLKGLEQLQKQIIKARTELKKLTKDTEEYKKKTAEIKTLGKQFDTLKGSMGQAATGANNLNKAGNRLVNTFKSAAVAIASAFAVRAIVGGLKNIVTAFTDFEAQLAAVKAISGATAEEFESLEKTARDFGATTIFTATQVGKLQEEFARLGFSVDEINAATGATLNLAAATGESLAKSAQIAGSTLRAFGKDAVQTQNVVDVMAASFTSSALNLDKFTESMKFVAPVARTTGFTLEETTALMANLADNGISGSIAGNALKNVFLRLGDESSKLAKRLGGPVTGLPELVEAMEKLKEEGFGATEAIELLDKRSAPAFLALMQNIGGLKTSVDILNNAEDAASRMSQIRLDTLEGDMTILKSAAEGLSIALGDEFDTNLRQIVFSLTNFIQSITNSDTALNAIKNTIKVASAILATLAVRLAAVGAVKLITGIKNMADSFMALRTAMLGASAATKTLTTAMKANIFINIATAVAGLAGAFFTLRRETSEAELAQKRLNNALLNELEAIIQLEEGTTARARAMRAFKGEFKEQLGLIDIELATEEELIELRELAIRQEEEKLELATNKSEIKRKEKELVLAKEQLKADKELLDNFDERLKKAEAADKKQGGSIKDGTAGQRAFLLIREKEKALKRQANAEDLALEIKALKEEREELQKSLALQLQDTEVYQRLRLKGEDTFRVKTKKLLDQQLIDFRKLQKDQQDIVIGKKEQELFEKSALVKFFDMVNAKSGLFGEDLTDMNNKIETFVEKMNEGEGGLKGFDIESRAAEISSRKNGQSIEKLGIEVSLLDNFFNDLVGSLKTGTKELKNFTEKGFGLNKVKDLTKELNKSLAALLTDRIENRKEAIRQELQTELDGLSKQRQLAVTNTQRIKKALESDNNEIKTQTILNNKSKFEVLKNLSVEELDILEKGGDASKELTQRLLTEMSQEELAKIKQNDQLVINLKQDARNKLVAIDNERIKILEDSLIEQERLRNDFGEQENRGIARRFRKQLRLIKQNGDNRIKQEIRNFNQRTGLNFDENRDFQTQLNEMLASDEEFGEARIRNAVQTGNAIKKINNNTTNEMIDAVSGAIDQFNMLFQMAFSAFETFATNQLALERQAIEERFDMDKRDRDDALQAELDALGDNEAAKENLRRIAAQREEDIEEKKNQELRKIAKKEFQIAKANQIVSALIQGALATVAALAPPPTGAGPIAGIPLAAIVGSLSALQVAAIASQKFVGKLGGMIPQFAKGGMVHGPSHAQGGVKFNAGGRVVELEGGEAVINKRSTAMFRPQLSAMNVAGGGISFQDGGMTPTVAGLANRLQSTQVSPEQQMQDFANSITASINTQEVVVTESSITQTQTDVSTIESNSTLF